MGKLTYIDFLPEKEDKTVGDLLAHVNKTVDAWKLKVVSIETMTLSTGSIGNRNSISFRQSVQKDSTGKKIYGDPGLLYNFFRVWYNAADPANRIPSVMPKREAHKAHEEDIAIRLDEKKESPCVVM